MRTILFAMSALGALAVAAPAVAQTGYQSGSGYQNSNGYQDQQYGRSGYQNQYGNQGQQYGRSGYQDEWSGSAGFDTRINQVELRVQDGITAGTIDRREAMRLRAGLRDLRRLERQYSYNGISQSERMDLQQRLRSLRQDVRIADGRRDDDRYGYDDGDQNGGRYDNAGRYDNGGRGNGYYGQGGPYEDAACDSRGGIGGAVDTMLGNGCLRVGQRATGSLSALPYEYRNRYRDGSGVYYRSDGRAIYRIDARTNTVLDVYGMDR